MEWSVASKPKQHEMIDDSSLITLKLTAMENGDRRVELNYFWLSEQENGCTYFYTDERHETRHDTRLKPDFRCF